MALKDMQPNAAAATATAPAFETETDTYAEDNMNTATDTAVAVAPAPAAVAVATPSKKFSMAFGDLKDAFPLDAVVGLSQALPRIKGEQGEAYIGDKAVGKKFKIEIESWNDRTLVSAGLDSKDPGYEEAKQYIANAYADGIVHGKDMTVKQYLDYLRSIGYDKAQSSQYIDLFGFVTWTSEKGDIAPEARELHLVQLSKTSASAFAAFCTTQGLLRSKGLVSNDSNEIEVSAAAQSKGSMKWTNFQFSTVK